VSKNTTGSTRDGVPTVSFLFLFELPFKYFEPERDFASPFARLKTRNYLLYAITRVIVAISVLQVCVAAFGIAHLNILLDSSLASLF
jgi:hypothetical protein